jgi:hypothetical protein
LDTLKFNRSAPSPEILVLRDLSLKQFSGSGSFATAGAGENRESFGIGRDQIENAV